jgi:alpha-tubulin suppressor-like RCC1 family protein
MLRCWYWCLWYTGPVAPGPLHAIQSLTSPLGQPKPLASENVLSATSVFLPTQEESIDNAGTGNYDDEFDAKTPKGTTSAQKSPVRSVHTTPVRSPALSPAKSRNPTPIPTPPPPASLTNMPEVVLSLPDLEPPAAVDEHVAKVPTPKARTPTPTPPSSEPDAPVVEQPPPEAVAAPVDEEKAPTPKARTPSPTPPPVVPEAPVEEEKAPTPKARTPSPTPPPVVPEAPVEDPVKDPEPEPEPEKEEVPPVLATFAKPPGTVHTCASSDLKAVAALCTDDSISDPLDRTVVQVVASMGHMLWRCASGRVYGYGDNSDHQLGLGAPPKEDGSTNTLAQEKKIPAHVAQPTRLKFRVPIVHLACGVQHGLAVSEDGRVWSWGNGLMGKLGHGNDADCLYPTEVKFFTERVIYVAAGPFNSAAVTASGVTYVWGANDSGQLGTGDTTPHATPHPLPALVSATATDGPSQHTRVTHVSFGQRHTLGLCQNGKLFAWGDNSFGQLGFVVEGQTAQHVPREVLHLSTHTIVEVVAGERHSMALNSDGAVFTWGSGETHQLGQLDNVDRPEPSRVLGAWPARNKIVSIATGASVSAAVTDEGIVYLWGFSIESPLPIAQSHLLDPIRQVGLGGPDGIFYLTHPPHDTYAVDITALALTPDAGTFFFFFCSFSAAAAAAAAAACSFSASLRLITLSLDRFFFFFFFFFFLFAVLVYLCDVHSSTCHFGGGQSAQFAWQNHCAGCL